MILQGLAGGEGVEGDPNPHPPSLSFFFIPAVLGVLVGVVAGVVTGFLRKSDSVLEDLNPSIGVRGLDFLPV
jgi:hypothetical protein